MFVMPTVEELLDLGYELTPEQAADVASMGGRVLGGDYATPGVPVTKRDVTDEPRDDHGRWTAGSVDVATAVGSSLKNGEKDLPKMLGPEWSGERIRDVLSSGITPGGAGRWNLRVILHPGRPATMTVALDGMSGSGRGEHDSTCNMTIFPPEGGPLGGPGGTLAIESIGCETKREGTGTALMRNAVELGRQLGATSATLSAADLGCYAWGRMGFLPDAKDWAEAVNSTSPTYLGPNHPANTYRQYADAKIDRTVTDPEKNALAHQYVRDPDPLAYRKLCDLRIPALMKDDGLMGVSRLSLKFSDKESMSRFTQYAGSTPTTKTRKSDPEVLDLNGLAWALVSALDGDSGDSMVGYINTEDSSDGATAAAREAVTKMTSALQALGLSPAQVIAKHDVSDEPRDDHGRWSALPAEPGTTSIPEGHVRLYHQTTADNVPGILREGLQLSKARGIEGPKAIYADEEGFYGKPGNRPTIEFHVPKENWRKPFVMQTSVPPGDIIAAHLPWHGHARYIESDPQVVQQILAGELDSLLTSENDGPAIRYIKAKYKDRPL